MQKENDEHSSIDFLKALYQYCKPDTFINLRFLPSAENRFVPLAKLNTIPFIVNSHQNQNCYFGVATHREGDGSKDGIDEIPSLWCDIDAIKGSPAYDHFKQIYKDFPLKPSILIESGGGYHLYWLLKEPSSKDDIPRVENLLKRISFHLGGDKVATDASRILRIPGTYNLKYAPKRKITIGHFHPEMQYSLDDFDILPREETSTGSKEKPQETINERLQKIMECTFLQHCDRDRATLPEPEWYAMVCTLARENGGVGLIHSLSQGYPQYSPKDTDSKILHALKDSGPTTCAKIKQMFACGKGCVVKSPVNLAWVKKGDPEETGSDTTKGRSEIRTEEPPRKSTSWPSPLAKEAFHGLAGEFVRLVEPNTEADPAALLTQFLSVMGNDIGANAYWRVEADRHYLKVNPILVGETAKGRKGTSIGYPIFLYRLVDPEWANNRISFGGLSSGEGLIWEVRDEIRRKEAIKEKGRVTKEFQEVMVDEGVADKRLLVVETEFSSALRVMSREGNTLSATIRQSWDDSNLRILTKNSPARSTGCHISIIGHISRDELRRYLDRTELANGFANRFLWVCVRRSKVLPEGGGFEEGGFNPIVKELRSAIEFGQSMGEIKKDDRATRLWADVYSDLSAGKPGLIGAVISRAETQVMRLACLYAVLDRSNTITTDHLLAALALWDYCEASARYIWGDATGDPVADRILGAIRHTDGGLSRTEISDLFLRHMSSSRIDLALSSMESLNLIKRTREVTGGRPVERWAAI